MIRDLQFHLNKLRGTIGLLANLLMARTFGTYQHTVRGGSFSYAEYRWRGQSWAIPTTPIEAQQ